MTTREAFDKATDDPEILLLWRDLPKETQQTLLRILAAIRDRLT